MIPKIIHYCWIGGAPLPELAERCIASWKKYMPEWEYMRWDEDSLTRAMQEPNLNPSLKGRTPKQAHNQSQDTKIWLDFMPTYVKQAYEARKFAFVSDYVRLWALERYGGLYMDVDFEVFRPFDDLMERYPAFAGYEGSKRKPVMQGVIASEPHGAWVQDMLFTYEGREFIKADGSLDLTPNTTYFSDRLEAQGFVADGVEKDFYVKSISNFKFQISNFEEPTFFLHVFPVHYFCPKLTTGENLRNEETYCEHMGLGSWNTHTNWRTKLVKLLGPKWKTRLIKLKRNIFG